MTPAADAVFRQLQREYLTEVPARLDELRADIARFRAGDPGAVSSLKTRLHQLAGSGGSYGFPEISAVARELEQWVVTGPSVKEAGRLDEGLGRLVGAFRRAGAEVVAPVSAESGTGGVPLALVVITAAPLRQRVTGLLESAGFRVRAGTRVDQPGAVAERRPERPSGASTAEEGSGRPGAGTTRRLDLLVIAGEPGEGDPSAVASSWTADADTRPRAVVLIETLRAVDRLRAVAAGIDAVIPAESIDPALGRYARTLVGIGAPPAGVLLVEPDVPRAEAIAGMLEAADIRVIRCHQARAVQELLEREIPDLILIDARLPELDAAAVAALVRQERRFYLHPVLLLGAGDPDARAAALRAGADDVIAEPVDAGRLVQAVVTRAERGRRLRELVHRDTLTGLLNTTTLLAELEHAVEYERRHGGTLAFVTFDLDGFRETVERQGRAVADQVLLHVATVFRANVRASDIIGRYRDEGFGMVLRGGTPQGAAVFAGKLHRVLAEHPYAAPDGAAVPVQIQVSVGSACFPGDGVTAGDLARAADRALERVKGRGGLG